MEVLVETWKRLQNMDYLVIVLILVVIATVGFLEGIVIGLLMSIALFVKLSIHIVERLELQFLLLHPMKNIKINSLRSSDISSRLLAHLLLDPEYKSKKLH